jgi:hypothetical protein
MRLSIKIIILAYFTEMRDLNPYLSPHGHEGNSGLLWHFSGKNGLWHD